MAGMIIGQHTRPQDLDVNLLKSKQLTNIRVAGRDDAVRLSPPHRYIFQPPLTEGPKARRFLSLAENPMTEYIPPALDWVRRQVELYEGSGGTEGTTRKGFPCIIVTHVGVNTGAIRKIPLIRVSVDRGYVLIGSYAGSPKHPAWVYNLRANPEVEVRDETEVFEMRVREVVDDPERQGLWDISAGVFPPYIEYQAKTSRQIPVFLAEPV